MVGIGHFLVIFFDTLFNHFFESFLGPHFFEGVRKKSILRSLGKLVIRKELLSKIFDIKKNFSQKKLILEYIQKITNQKGQPK